MKRANWTYLAATAIVLSAGVSVAGARATHQKKSVDTTRQGNRGHHKALGNTSTTATAPTPTTTAATTTTVRATTTTTAPPTTTTLPPTTTTTIGGAQCVGVPMTAGQADINANAAGTTYCLSGTHNWTLTPKAGDKLIGPAILDGGNATAHAIVATAPNVTLASLTIQHYNNGNGTQDAAIHIADDSSVKAAASGWLLANLNVGFNSASGSGAGDNWTFLGGRLHDNRQEGIGGAVGNGVTVDGVEIDHNNFRDTTYTTRNWSCGDEAGGFKWVTNNVTVTNSRIHDNACKGLWADLNGDNAVITNNQVYNNWDEGIFIEISSGAIVTGNTVTGNGWHNYNGDGSGCPWTFGGGITLASSDHAQVAHNTVSGNCNGITGNQQDRPDGHPGLLSYVSVSANAISGAGVTGVAEDNGADLTQRSIVFSSNTFGGGIDFCNLSC
jgi:parallel beta-helix repeat protein